MLPSAFRGLLVIAGLCCLFSGFQSQNPMEIHTEEEDRNYEERLPCQHTSYNIIQLSFALYQKSESWVKDSNILFSPVNVIAASLMLSLGAKNDTHYQIMDRLNFTDTIEAYLHVCLKQLIYILHLPDHKPQLTIKSDLFTDQSLKLMDEFVKGVNGLYFSKVIPINFKDAQGALKQINEYVESETQGKVGGFVKDLEKDTTFTLINYIFFQGKEYEAVEVEHTVEQDFYVNKDMTVKVPMINRRGRYFLYRDEKLSSLVMVKHYMGDATAFFILPDQGKMQRLEKILNQYHLKNILNLAEKRIANLYFPKLSMSTTYDLKTILSTVGITQIFSNEADFSGITQDAPLKLNKALHKTVLTFHDEVIKTERNISLSKRDLSKVPVIRFNSPFLIFIRDEYTNIPLIMGRVTNPIESS